MKIAVPTNDEIHVSEHFGRSLGFLVFDIDAGKLRSREFRANGMKHEHAQGECHNHGEHEQAHSHQGILSAIDDCQLVLALGMGGRAAVALKQAGVETMFLAEPGTADDVINAYLDGTLKTVQGSLCQCHH